MIDTPLSRSGHNVSLEANEFSDFVLAVEMLAMEMNKSQLKSNENTAICFHAHSDLAKESMARVS